MTIEVLKCPHCGAPLPPGSGGVVVCSFCNRTLTGVPSVPGGARDEPAGDLYPGRPRVHVGGATYAVMGRVARGEGSDVFLARRDARLTELVLLKVLRAAGDADLLAREWKMLEALHASTAQGAAYFTSLLPQPVAHGTLANDAGYTRAASVFRWRSGFQHTLEDVAREYPDGVDPRAAVWMWKRALELLGWVHRAGYVHGAVLPQHLLVHPRDHGVVLAGWSAAVRSHPRASEPLPVTCAAGRAYYPDDAWTGALPTPATDITMSARCIARALGGDPWADALPDAVPGPLAALVRAYADPASRAGGRTDDAWALMERVGQAGREAFGPPRYHPFTMPGWRR